MASVTCLSCGRRGVGDAAGTCTQCGGILIRAGALETPPEFDFPEDSPGEESPESGRLAPGSTFLRYHVEKVLGEGAQGIVYLVNDPELNRTVALKTLKPEMFASQQLLTRFHREAELAGRVRHPSIATIYDYGVHNGTPYYTMEYMKGRTLETFIADKGRLPNRTALHIAELLGMALDHAHKEGVIHRDIKPANILISASGDTTILVKGESPGSLRVLLTDFGIAHDEIAETRLTASGAMIGTPMYMSPEQVDNTVGKIDGRTDQYALGTVLYEMLTGHPPFEEETIPKLLIKVASVEPTSLGTHVSGINRDTETIVLKMLNKSQDRRYASCGLVVEDIRKALRGDPISARPTSLGEKVVRRLKKNKATSFAGAMALLMGLLLSGFLLWNSGQPERKELALFRAQAQSKNELETNLQEWLVEAREAYTRGDLAACREICNRIEKSAPPDPKALSLPEPFRSRDDLAILRRPWNIPLPETYLLLADVSEKEGDDVRAMANLVRAYHSAMLQLPAPSPVAPKALLEMGIRFESREEWDRATGAFEGVRRQFPGSKEAALAAAHLFVTCPRKKFDQHSPGRGNEVAALAWGEKAIEEGALLPESRKEDLQEEVSLFKKFVPVQTLNRNARAWTLGDLSGNGRPDFVWVDSEGYLLKTDLVTGQDERHPFVSEAVIQSGTVALSAADADQDGRSEIFCFVGSAQKNTGEMFLLKWNKKPVILHREKITAEGKFCWAKAADLDGNGQTEVIIGLGYFQKELLIGRLAGKKFSILDRFSILSDPLSGVVIDLDGIPGKELILSTGGWNARTGYSIRLVKWSGPGKVIVGSLFSQMTFAENLFNESRNIYFRNQLPEKHRDAIKIAASGKKILGQGMYRALFSGSGYSPPEPVNSWPFPIDFRKEPGNAGLTFQVSGQVRVENRKGISVLIGEAEGKWALAEMDGDSIPEPVRILKKDGRMYVSVFGIGPVPETSLPDSTWGGSGKRNPVLAAVEELFSLGFFEEALQLAQSPQHQGETPDIQGNLSKRAGDCLRELGKIEKALEAYREATRIYPPISNEVASSEIHVLEEAEWWPELARTLQRFLQSGTHSPAERNLLQKKLDGARSMAALQPVRSLESAELWSVDPFLVERSSPREWLWRAPSLGSATHLSPIPTPSGSFRLRTRFVVEEVGWERQFEWGIVRLLGTDPPVIAEKDFLRIEFRFSGSGNAPTARYSFFSKHTPSGLVREGTACQPGDSWTIDLGYIAHLRRITLRILTPGGETWTRQWENVPPFPGGNYGLLLRSADRYGRRDFEPASVRLEEYTLHMRPQGEGAPWIAESPEGILQQMQGVWIQQGKETASKRINILLPMLDQVPRQPGSGGMLSLRQRILLNSGLLSGKGNLLYQCIEDDVIVFFDWMRSRYRYLPKPDLAFIRTVIQNNVDENFVRGFLSELKKSVPGTPANPGNIAEIDLQLKTGKARTALHSLLSGIYDPDFADALLH